MEETETGLCPSTSLAEAVEQLRIDQTGGLTTIAQLIAHWPLDPRLHFLQGSILASAQRYDEGRRAMARAVEIAPDFALARFQLGFLDLSSGRAFDAMAVWNPLGSLPDDNALRVLAEGLTAMAADQFTDARRLIESGMALNQDNPLINTDMQLILDEIAGLANKPMLPDPGITGDATARLDSAEDEVGAPASAVDLLLQQSRLRGGGRTRH